MYAGVPPAPLLPQNLSWQTKVHWISHSGLKDLLLRVYLTTYQSHRQQLSTPRMHLPGQLRAHGPWAAGPGCSSILRASPSSHPSRPWPSTPSPLLQTPLGRLWGRDRIQVKGGGPEMGTRSSQYCLPEDALETRPLFCPARPDASTHVIHGSKDRSNMEGGHRRQVRHRLFCTMAHGPSTVTPQHVL